MVLEWGGAWVTVLYFFGVLRGSDENRCGVSDTEYIPISTNTRRKGWLEPDRLSGLFLLLLLEHGGAHYRSEDPLTPYQNTRSWSSGYDCRLPSDRPGFNSRRAHSFCFFFWFYFCSIDRGELPCPLSLYCFFLGGHEGGERGAGGRGMKGSPVCLR